jgi:hypothetical protein
MHASQVSERRTRRGAPTGLNASISFQYPFNRAGGRTSNVRLQDTMNNSLKQACRRTLAAAACIGFLSTTLYAVGEESKLPQVARDRIKANVGLSDLYLTGSMLKEGMAREKIAEFLIEKHKLELVHELVANVSVMGYKVAPSSGYLATARAIDSEYALSQIDLRVRELLKAHNVDAAVLYLYYLFQDKPDMLPLDLLVNALIERDLDLLVVKGSSSAWVTYIQCFGRAKELLKRNKKALEVLREYQRVMTDYKQDPYDARQVLGELLKDLDS